MNLFVNSINVLLLNATINSFFFRLNELMLNPFVPNAPFLYPLKTLEILKVFCFQGIEKGCIGNKSVNSTNPGQNQFYRTKYSHVLTMILYYSIWYDYFLIFAFALFILHFPQYFSAFCSYCNSVRIGSKKYTFLSGTAEPCKS